LIEKNAAYTNSSSMWFHAFLTIFIIFVDNRLCLSLAFISSFFIWSD